MAQRLRALLLLTALPLAAWPAAHAQPGLSDPTRPPSPLVGTAREGGPREASGLRLQSILISPQRSLAVINGTAVPLGGKFDQATLVQIAETHVTLKQGNELKTLELYPGIARKAPGPAQGAISKKGNP